MGLKFNETCSSFSVKTNPLHQDGIIIDSDKYLECGVVDDSSRNLY